MQLLEEAGGLNWALAYVENPECYQNRPSRPMGLAKGGQITPPKMLLINLGVKLINFQKHNGVGSMQEQVLFSVESLPSICCIGYYLYFGNNLRSIFRNYFYFQMA